MYIDLIILILLILLVVMFFKRFSSFVFAMAIIDIFLRILSFIKNNSPMENYPSGYYFLKFCFY